MPNMNPKKLPAREQAPDVRNKNFDEVSHGYDAAMAVEEATRCLQCKHKPCVSGCPVNVRIPEFVKAIAEEKFDDAYDILKSTNSLPAICGRVCPQETQCEQKCVRAIKGEPVGIGRLERFAADHAMQKARETGSSAVSGASVQKNGKKVAVIGSGPAGLTCAGDLAKLGYDVTIFEALHTPGGVLMYGIPEFRLPKALVREEIATVENLGVNILTNTVVGRSISLDE
jgi:glutamate synthase (NADPH/NADH) small chain